MKKLLKLREEFTLEQAAEWASIIFECPLTVADILQFALDGQLRLSVKFINRTKARPGKVVRFTEQQIQAFKSAQDYHEDLNWVEDLSAIFAAKKANVPCPDPLPKIMTSVRLGPDSWMSFDDEVVTIAGIWDLPMVGNEKFDVQFEFLALTGGPEVTMVNIDGTFVIDEEGRACQLMECVEPEVRTSPTMPPQRNDYFPAGGLPSDAVLVVRKTALKALERLLLDELDSTTGNTSCTRLIRTHRVVIAALCKALKIDYKARGAAKAIEKLTDLNEVMVTDDTIKRSILDHIDDAMESRSQT